MSPRVVLLDSGGANLGSVQAAFARLGVEAPVATDPDAIAQATHVVLPGVGAAAACMARLRENGLDQCRPRCGECLFELARELLGGGRPGRYGAEKGSVDRRDSQFGRQ